MRKTTGYPLWAVWQVHRLFGLPHLSPYRTLAGSYGDRVSGLRKRPSWGNHPPPNPSGSHVLRLFALSRLRFYQLEETASAAVPTLRRTAGRKQPCDGAMYELRQNREDRIASACRYRSGLMDENRGGSNRPDVFPILFVPDSLLFCKHPVYYRKTFALLRGKGAPP